MFVRQLGLLCLLVVTIMKASALPLSRNMCMQAASGVAYMVCACIFVFFVFVGDAILWYKAWTCSSAYLLCNMFFLWYKAWTCSLAFFCSWYLACASSFLHGLELSFLAHVLGICMVPRDYGSRSPSVAGVGGFLPSRTRHLHGSVGLRFTLPGVAAVGDVTQMPDRNGWRSLWRGLQHTHHLLQGRLPRNMEAAPAPA